MQEAYPIETISDNNNAAVEVIGSWHLQFNYYLCSAKKILLGLLNLCLYNMAIGNIQNFWKLLLMFIFCILPQNVHIKVILSTRKIFFRYRLVYDVRNTFLVACLLFVSFCHMNILRGRCCVCLLYTTY